MKMRKSTHLWREEDHPRDDWGRFCKSNHLGEKIVDNSRPNDIIILKNEKDWGFNYIKGNHTREQDLAATNPKYGIEGKKYTHNCQRCVSTYEARRRGYDVEAMPYILNGIDTLPYTFHKQGWMSVYENAQPVYCVSNSTAEIKTKVEATMYGFGNGSRAIVAVQWQKKYGGGHVFIAEQVDGKTIFIDPQNNNMDVSYYFTMASLEDTFVLRVDNLKFTDNIRKCCKNRGDN